MIRRSVGEEVSNSMWCYPTFEKEEVDKSTCLEMSGRRNLKRS